MNLFIETPQQVSERLARERRSHDAWLEAMQQQYARRQARDGAGAAAPATGAVDDEAARRAAQASLSYMADLDIDEPDEEAGIPSAEGGASDGGGRAARAQGRARRRADDGYSVAQASYHDELAFQKRRARHRRLAIALRTLALIVLIPVLLVAVFIGSYVFTCILNGATPQEVGDLLHNMFSRVEGFILSLSS